MRYAVPLLAAASLLAGAAFAQTPTTVVFLGKNNKGADDAIMTYLVGRYGMANVTRLNTEPSGTITAAHIEGPSCKIAETVRDSVESHGACRWAK